MMQTPMNARRRAVIERVRPEVDSGRFAIKRVVGESVVVEADVFADGHDQLSCRVLYWHGTERNPQSSPMELLANDRWRGEFPVPDNARYEFTIEAWTDVYASWLEDLRKRVAVEEPIRSEVIEGINASRKIIVTTEKIVDSEAVRRDPNRTITPPFRVSAVVEQPWGAHPMHLAGCYNGDMFGNMMDMRNEEGYEAYMQNLVYGTKDWNECLQKKAEVKGPDYFKNLEIKNPVPSEPIISGS